MPRNGPPAYHRQRPGPGHHAGGSPGSVRAVAGGPIPAQPPDGRRARHQPGSACHLGVAAVAATPEAGAACSAG
eukprot:10335211-Alexandrium_andersonii.AAC.1